jgi:RND family efflux transporter MFP subunit
MPNNALSVLSISTLFLLSGCQKEKNTVKLPPTLVQPDSPNPSKRKRAQNKKTRSPAPKAPTDTTSADTTPPKPANAPKAQQTGGVGFGVLNGTTRAFRTAVLAPQVSGKIIKLDIVDGQRIKKGEKLVVLDRSDFLLGLRAARAARDTAKAQLNAVEVEWRRLKGLVAAKAIPSGQFDKVDAQRNVAITGLAQAKIAIARGQSALAKTVVTAPFNAVVLKKMVEVGSYATVMPPTMLLMIADIDTIEVLVSVPERFMRQVAVGTKLELSFSALDLKKVAAVQRIIPAVDPQTRSFAAVVQLSNPKHRLKPGMFVEVRAAEGSR